MRALQWHWAAGTQVTTSVTRDTNITWKAQLAVFASPTTVFL